MWKLKIKRTDNSQGVLLQENNLLGKKAFQFQAILDSMVEGVIVFDRQGNIVFLNPAIEKIFSIRKDACLQKPLLESIRNAELFEMYTQALHTQETVSGEINMLLPIRKAFHVNAVAVKQESVVMILNDITEMRHLETVRKDFVANVSHELKTPLTSIKGFVETLLDGAIDDKEHNRKFLQIMQEHTQRLERLISDLLALSQLESEEIKIALTDIELSSLIKGTLENFRPLLKEKHIDVKTRFSAPVTVKADDEKLRQVLNNLIDNAIKFNREKGSIIIAIEDTQVAVKVVIEDSGCGIPEKDLSRIFERFYRVDKARSRSLGGTGLGLSIVKHIIELHKGAVGVESIEGQGSKFYFSLPK